MLFCFAVMVCGQQLLPARLFFCWQLGALVSVLIPGCDLEIVLALVDCRVFCWV